MPRAKPTDSTIPRNTRVAKPWLSDYNVGAASSIDIAAPWEYGTVKISRRSLFEILYFIIQAELRVVDKRPPGSRRRYIMDFLIDSLRGNNRLLSVAKTRTKFIHVTLIRG